MHIRFAGIAGMMGLIGLVACAEKPMTAAAPAPAATASVEPQVPMVGGAPMYPNKDIIDNAVNSKDHETLVAAVKQAGLVDTLKGPGPFTVFAPTDDAFEVLPAGTVATLMKPASKAKLTRVLTYHVVPGKLDAQALRAKIAEGKGRAVLKTVAGNNLIARLAAGGRISITDAKGRTGLITQPDVYQSNGVIHVTNTVFLPPG